MRQNTSQAIPDFKHVREDSKSLDVREDSKSLDVREDPKSLDVSQMCFPLCLLAESVAAAIVQLVPDPRGRREDGRHHCRRQNFRGQETQL